MKKDISSFIPGANRRDFLRAAGAAAFLFGPAMRASASAAARPPNVIVLLSDDQGYGDFSCHGNPVLKTPALDKLHSQSVRFTDFHVAPMCTPTRGQLLSGQDALHNGATSVTAGRALLRRGLPTLGDLFTANGYATGMFGKWHVGDTWPYRPMDRGFSAAQYFHGYGMSSAVEFDNDYFDGGYFDNGVRKHFSGYCTDFWFAGATKWMADQQRKNQPFFCYIPTNVPHGPAWVDDYYSGPYTKGERKLPAAFFGMIANLDENLAKLEGFLERSGLRDNTIFIFMTDNGGTGGVNIFNAGMRGKKTEYYEGGHRVPCFVRWPNGGLRAPGDIDVNAEVQDIPPTLVDLCGLKDTRGAQFDGASLAGLLKGSTQTLPDRTLVVQYGQILKKWDSCVVWKKWRLVHGTELYDLASDPGQARDIAQKHPDILKRLRDYYESWWQRRESGLREYMPISIGSDKENPLSLCSADWQDIYADNPLTVLNAGGGAQGGPWNIQVERDGEYEIGLRRWHPRLNIAIDAPCPVQKRRKGQLPFGPALPIARAQLRIAGGQQSAKVATGDTSAKFKVRLKGGTQTQLQGWFQDAQGKDLCGAYYADVRRT
jgi:arylsulfatase A-like enzyme